MPHNTRTPYATQTRSDRTLASTQTPASPLDAEAYDFVQRHVDPDAVEQAQAEPGMVRRALDAFTSAEEPVAIAQGALFIATGVWPIVHIPTFEAVSGPKTDKWLVKTVGALITVAGAAIASAGVRRRINPEIRLLAMGSSIALAAVDVVYARRRRISRVYLLDAAAEVALILAWLTAMGRQPDDATAPA